MTPIPPILYLSRKLDDPATGIEAGKILLAAVERCITDEEAALEYAIYLDEQRIRSEAEAQGRDPEDAVRYESDGDVNYDRTNLNTLLRLQELITWFITPPERKPDDAA